MSIEHSTILYPNCSAGFASSLEIRDTLLSYQLQYPKNADLKPDEREYRVMVGIHEQTRITYKDIHRASRSILINQLEVTPNQRILVKQQDEKLYKWMKAEELDQQKHMLVSFSSKHHLTPITTLKTLNKATIMVTIETHNNEPYMASECLYLLL